MIEELELEELGMKAVEYLEPYCHGAKMVPTFIYISKKPELYKQFRCNTCGHVESRVIAVPL